MNRLFLGTSFSGHVNYETGEVNPDYRKKIEDVIDALRTVGNFMVFCAVEHEQWVIANDISPEVGVEKDLAEIDESDAMLALLPTGLISAGLQYEIGYADARGRRVLLATETGTELAYFNQGAVNLGRATHIEYDSPESLATQVQAALA
ncbi:MAG TPA: nucleoside 2-deoxyribosyltransferase [Candidatus Saccharimonadales bacterium]|nr:nucleoside 2-deoxyribosyltransferase [Candidatus Saccharimonadales bacterium]